MNEERDPNALYVHVAEFLPVQAYGQVLDVMGLSMRIYRQARESDGYVAGGLKAKWWRKEFWSFTVWEDRDAMERFVRGPLHAQAAARVLDLAAPGACYVEWVAPGPADWPEAVEHLKSPTRYFVPPPLIGLR